VTRAAEQGFAMSGRPDFKHAFPPPNRPVMTSAADAYAALHKPMTEPERRGFFDWLKRAKPLPPSAFAHAPTTRPATPAEVQAFAALLFQRDAPRPPATVRIDLWDLRPPTLQALADDLSPPPSAAVAAAALSLPPAPPTPVTTPAGTAPPAANATAADTVPIYSDRGGRGVRVDVKVGGVFVRMLIDTGSTDILISNSLAGTLVGAGDAEWLPDTDVTLADGTKIKSRNVKIHRVSIGEHTLIDVEAGVNPSDTGDMLLGFPVLNLFGKFTIDTNANQLTFGSFANR
jgi:clan AA aspartic protease (TIGR02281 family)